MALPRCCRRGSPGFLGLRGIDRNWLAHLFYGDAAVGLHILTRMHPPKKMMAHSYDDAIKNSGTRVVPEVRAVNKDVDLIL